MLLTIIFDFRVIKLWNYPKISHLGHVNEILMQNPACAVLRWQLIRGEQKIVWLYKQLVYCPGHSVITISQQWCDCTRLWSEGRRGRGISGSTSQCLCITFILPLYSPAHGTTVTHQRQQGEWRWEARLRLWWETFTTFYYAISVVSGP